MAKKFTLDQNHKDGLREYSISNTAGIEKNLSAAVYCSQRKMRVVLPENDTENNELWNISKNWSTNTWLRIRYFHGESQGIWFIKTTLRLFCVVIFLSS